MRLEQFLDLIAGELVEVVERNTFVYEADKNAIRKYKPELLDREVYRIEPSGLTRLTVYIREVA